MKKKSTMECHYSIIFTLIVHHDKYDNDDDDDDANNCLKAHELVTIFFSHFFLFLTPSSFNRKIKINRKKETRVDNESDTLEAAEEKLKIKQKVNSVEDGRIYLR